LSALEELLAQKEGGATAALVHTHMACVFHTIILDELKALEHTTRYDYLIHHRIYQLTRDVELDKETTSKWAIIVFLSSS
jgi:hypothetical protein